MSYDKIAYSVGKAMFNLKNKCEICEREVKGDFKKCYTCNMKEKNPDIEFLCKDCNKKVKDGFIRCFSCNTKNKKIQNGLNQ